jgi:hypothetical protein
VGTITHVTQPDGVLGVLFDQVGEGGTIDRFPISVDLDSVLELTSPVLPPAHPDLPQIADQVHHTLRHSKKDTYPLSHQAEALADGVRLRLEQYAQLPGPGHDHLYVLEFQGRDHQYVMFGRSRQLKRRLRTHDREAALHGFVLLDGWASPPVADARPLERLCLTVGDWMHQHSNRSERYYGMPFSKGLSIARAVYEFGSEWPSPLYTANR